GALAQVERAIEIDPGQPRALAMLGFLSLESGNTNRARAAVEQLARLAPQSAEYRELRAALPQR
ncbi:MAG: tetratricopeptide repeat protein, partial [Verrucomicrobiota bacterium]